MDTEQPAIPEAIPSAKVRMTRKEKVTLVVGIIVAVLVMATVAIVFFLRS